MTNCAIEAEICFIWEKKFSFLAKKITRLGFGQDGITGGTLYMRYFSAKKVDRVIYSSTRLDV